MNAQVGPGLAHKATAQRDPSSSLTPRNELNELEPGWYASQHELSSLMRASSSNDVKNTRACGSNAFVDANQSDITPKKPTRSNYREARDTQHVDSEYAQLQARAVRPLSMPAMPSCNFTTTQYATAHTAASLVSVNETGSPRHRNRGHAHRASIYSMNLNPVYKELASTGGGQDVWHPSERRSPGDSSTATLVDAVADKYVPVQPRKSLLQRIRTQVRLIFGRKQRDKYPAFISPHDTRLSLPSPERIPPLPRRAYPKYRTGRNSVLPFTEEGAEERAAS